MPSGQGPIEMSTELLASFCRLSKAGRFSCGPAPSANAGRHTVIQAMTRVGTDIGVLPWAGEAAVAVLTLKQYEYRPPAGCSRLELFTPALLESVQGWGGAELQSMGQPGSGGPVIAFVRQVAPSLARCELTHLAR